MTFKMSKTDQTITVYNMRADTLEFIGKGDAFIPALTGLPAYCTTVSPPETDSGFIAVFDVTSQSWQLSEDHRGEVVFETQTGKPISITEPGSYPPEITTIAPQNVWQQWDGEKWVDDKSAFKEALIIEAETNKRNKLTDANQAIATLQDAVDFDMATDEEFQKLTMWKKYRIFLNRIDTSEPVNIEWPDVPL